MFLKTQEELIALLQTQKKETKMQIDQVKVEENKLKEMLAKRVCSTNCNDNNNHIGDCLVCGKHWNNHPIGHDCPDPLEGNRGVWRLKN